jgi:predicted RNase H-like HicB family nuclease
MGYRSLHVVKPCRTSRKPRCSCISIECYLEDDGRWLADIAALPGVTPYGRTKKHATAAVQVLALRLVADRLEHGETLPRSPQ